MTEQLTDDLSDTRPGTAPAPETDARPRAKLLDLSVTQLIGGSMAAATAAALGSRLGVVGTIAGAAVLSVVSATAASLYTNSMARAKEAVVLVRSRRGTDGVEVAVVRERRWRRPDRMVTRRVLATTAAVFAIAAAFLTGVQLTTGAQVTGTNLGGRTSAGAVVDSPVASHADQAQQGGRAAVAPAPTVSAVSSPAPTATAPTTAPTTGTGSTAAPATTDPAATGGTTPAPTGTPTPSGGLGGSTGTGTPTAPAPGASTPPAP